MKQNNAAHLLATAYLSSTRAPRALKTIKALCYIGLTIGAGALMLALIITHGFEQEIGLKMKGINSDAIIEAPGNQLDVQELQEYITTALPDAVHGISASSTRHLIITHNDKSRVLFLRGIIGSDEAKTTILESKITAPEKATLDQLLNHESSLIIGSQFATINNLWIGSVLTVYVPQEAGRNKLALEKKEMHITGIFNVGLEDYDANVAFCRYQTLQKYYENCTGADHMAITFKQAPWHKPTTSWLDWLYKNYQKMRVGDDGYYRARLNQLARLLPGLSVRSWQELYPDLVASLELEKYAISIVLGLIAFVASMLMICLLFMFVQYKQVDIAILRTMGMHTKAIYFLFIQIGMTIVIRSVVTGIALAWLVGWYIKTCKPIVLPEIYYIAYLPAALEPIHAVVVGLGTIFLGLLACQLPLWQLNKLSIASVVRGG
jgi:lipoprotein-releasing system permease protein